MAETCPTCGTAVRVVSGDEGTAHFEPIADAPLLGHNRTLADVRKWLTERRDHEVRNAPTADPNTPASGMTMGALETLDALLAYLNGDDDA